MYVRELDVSSEWTKFIASCPDATFYHTPEWMELLKRSFSIDTLCYAVEENGEIVGIFPVAITKKLFFKTFDSLPYSDFGGPIIRADLQKPALQSISEYLKKKSRENGIVSAKITFSEKDSCTQFSTENSTIDESLGVMVLDLHEKTPEYIWNKVFDSRRGQRKYLNRFERDGFQVFEVENELHLKSFYSFYRQNLKFIRGTPFPYRFFYNAWKSSNPEWFVVLVVENNGFKGGLGFFVHKEKNTAFLNYMAIDRRFLDKRYHITDYMVWQAINWAHKRNIQHVSLGTTPNDSNSFYYRQKTNFGSVFIPQYRLTIPYKNRGFRLRKKIISSWNGMRGKLPFRIRCILER